MSSLLRLQYAVLLTHLIKLYSLLQFTLDKTTITYDITLYDINPLLRNLQHTLPVFKLCFGSPESQCFNLGISTTTSSSVIEDSTGIEKHFKTQFNETKSSTYDKQSSRTLVQFRILQTSLLQVLSKVVFDYISFPNEPLSNNKFTFLVFTADNPFPQTNVDGYLGMIRNHFEPYSYRNTSSFLNFLYTERVMNDKVFALKYNREGSGLFTIGENYTDYNNMSLCNCSDSEQSIRAWDCYLNKVKVGDQQIALFPNSTIKFDSIRNYISAPNHQGRSVLELIIKLFESNIGKDTCQYERDPNLSYTLLICSKDINVNKIPDLHLILKDIDLRIQWIDLFRLIPYNNTNAYVPLFFLDHQLDETNETIWTIGIPGFYDRTIVFNKSDKTIGFIFDNSNSQYNHNDIIVMILCIITIILIIGVCYIFILLNPNYIKRINMII